MGNIIRSFTSGFTTVITDLFSSPLDFLSGKSCSSVCGSTWDFICYIENFCIANLLRLVIILVLFYIVLLFFYISYKLGIYECIFHSLCKMTWGCLSFCFCLLGNCFMFFCNICTDLITNHRQRRELSGSEYSTTELQEYNYEPISSRISSRRRRSDCRKTRQLRKYLRPRNHRIGVGLNAESEFGGYGRNYSSSINHGRNHNVRVIHSSRFVKKGTNLRPKVYSKVEW